MRKDMYDLYTLAWYTELLMLCKLITFELCIAPSVLLHLVSVMVLPVCHVPCPVCF
jgi:hypothetical protein